MHTEICFLPARCYASAGDVCNALTLSPFWLVAFFSPQCSAHPYDETDLWTFHPFVSLPSGHFIPKTFRPRVSK